ncbi:MAG: chromosome segregation protein SMC, partial [Pseudomonadota bacterium]
EVAALSAEVNALAKLLDRETSDRGQVLDQLRVTPGYEKALGAALADDLRAPISGNDDASGWVGLPGYSAPQVLPEGVTALANYVTVPEVLVRRIGQIGLVERAQGAAMQTGLKPGQRLVSLEGDLWRWDGFRAGADDAPSATALRLQQLNRLEELKQELVQANARVEGASRAHDVLRTRLAELTEADRRARDARKAADAQVTETSRALSRAEADCNIAEGRSESLRLAVSRHEDEATQARGAVKEAAAAQASLEDLDTARATVEDAKIAVEAARIKMMSCRAAHDEIKHAGEARRKRLAQIEKEHATWTGRWTVADQRFAELSGRRTTAEEELAEAADVPGQIAAEREKLTDTIQTAETRRKASSDVLAKAETDLREATIHERDCERQAGEAREARAAAEARAEAALAAQRAATEQITEAQNMSPEDLLETLDADPGDMPSSEKIEHEVNRLKRQRDALGAVNLRAEEDAKAVQEEHDTLISEKADLEEAIRKLRGGIGALNREGRERLLTAFEQVNSNFSMLFTHLFGGGEANLVLVESDDPLEAGLEIMCQPPGKKLSTLSLLSGGEQTLTALALIFAVFLANPAPICVLDEVDAPLDDANVTRFCDLLDEMTRRTETRFLIITHHAVTMARMDRLFGVTMAEQGVSQLVSVDLKKAEQMVA